MSMNYAEGQYIIDSFNTEYPKQERNGIALSYFDWSTSASGDKIYVQFVPKDTSMNDLLLVRLSKIVICIKKSKPLNIDDYEARQEIDRSSLSMNDTNEIIFNGMDVNTTYYIRLFPISDHNVVSYDKRFVQTVETQSLQIMSFHQDFNDVNPETTITYTGSNSNYIPVNNNASFGNITNGTWNNWSWLQKIKPCMIRHNGEFDYELDPTDYTKKKDGSPSDISNSSYQGGAFVWFPKLYMKEVYAEDGSSRDVYFTDNPNDETTRDFKPVGFTMSDGTVVNGLWIPMFYPGDNWEIKANASIRNDRGTGYFVADDLTFSSVRSVWSRGIYFGFPLTNVLRDLLYMLYRSTNIQAHTANGSTAGVNKIINSSGMFEATLDGYVKLFHTIIIGSHLAYILDPYYYTLSQVNVNNTYIARWFRVANNYSSQRVDISEFADMLTNIGNNGEVNLTNFGSKLTYINNMNTSIPIYSSGGSSTTGLCDQVKIRYSGYRDSTGFGGVMIYGLGADATNGPAYMNIFAQSGNTWPVNTGSNVVKIPMIRPTDNFDLE